MKNLTFSIAINAPVGTVWDKMLDQTTYRIWAKPFCDGTYYIGSWDEGEEIRFFDTAGGGMTSVIAENRLHEYISVKHLGFIQNGVDDTESEVVKSWAPALENYSFRAVDITTELTVDLDVTEDYEAYMQDAWPKALQALKNICEVN